MSADFSIATDGEAHPPRCEFAGDLFLSLASRGMFVLEPRSADRFIAQMSAALDQVRVRCGLIKLLGGNPVGSLAAEDEVAEQALFDIAFAEQVAPGRLDQAMVELPKYIQAFEIAKKAWRPPQG